MKKLLIFLAILVSGGAGYQLGFTISKKRYENLADEEVKSVKQALADHYEKLIDKNLVPKKKEVKIDSNKPLDGGIQKGSKEPLPKEAIDYSKPYRSDSEPDRIPGSPGEKTIVNLKKEEVDTTKPYVITPEDFQDSEYECVTLYYFADKVLADSDYNQIDNIGIVGGYPNLEQMGVYDADCLYVRDEKKGIDYEILLEERTFSRIRPLGVVNED